MEIFASRTFNAICFIAHISSAIVMTVAATCSDVFGVDGRVQLYIPVPTIMNDGAVMESFSNPSIFSFLAAFSFITSFFHGFYFIMSGNQRYSIRFVEYGFTASIMAFVLAILCGINNIFTLVGIFGLTMSTMLFGFLQEISKDSIAPFIFGCTPYLFMWLIVTWQFERAMEKLDVPHFVVALFVLEILLFSSFAIVQLLNRLMVVINDKTADGVYNALSLTSKMILIWVCFGGILGQQKNNNFDFFFNFN